jgi:hypothetical protein
MERDGWKRDHEVFWGKVRPEFPVTEADRAEWAGDDTEDVDGADGVGNPYRKLPPRVALDDIVGEVDTTAPPFDPIRDPNREVANRWGAGMVGF